VTLHVLVPDGVDDPQRPSGGNVYDRRLVAGLVALGREVREHRVGAVGLDGVLAGVADGAVVLVDGLVASTTAGLVEESRRLRVAVLLHMPGSGPAEPAVLRGVAAVVVTSDWSRRWVVDEVGVPADRVHVALPGVDPGPLVAGSGTGGNLLVVGSFTPAKGYDDLLAALAAVRDLDWTCRCVGSLDLAPAFADAFRVEADRLGVADRIELTGPLPPTAVEELRSASDLVVAPSHREAYGMALAEGLARGLPAIATDVGGHPEVLGTAGLLVRVGDPAALGGALRSWLGDAGLRERWRAAAAQRRQHLGSWSGTASEVDRVLNRIAPAAVLMGNG
jgi:glycosyltransferase involved in cell wall biosynthesis